MSAHGPGLPGGPPGPHGAVPPGWPPPMDHPDAKPALVMGIVALGGFFVCLLPVVVAPFAWAKGARAMREIDASGGRLTGRGDAQGGMVLGIVGTVLLGLGVLFFLLMFVVLAILGTKMVAVFEETQGNV